jgi:hypothetical protein
MDCFVAEFIIGPAEGGTRWLLAMTSIPTPSFRDAPLGAGPESRDSGSGPSDHPGMTNVEASRHCERSEAIHFTVRRKRSWIASSLSLLAMTNSRQICPTDKSLLIFRNRVKPRNQKYSAFAVGQISARTSAVLPTEGRAHVTNAERDAVDAAASGERMRAGRMMLMRTAKSCGSDAPMLASSLR